MEVIVVCHASDCDTITEAKRAIYELNVPWVRVETFSNPPISKPHGLNVGFRRSSNQVLAIVDAEDLIQSLAAVCSLDYSSSRELADERTSGRMSLSTRLASD